MKKKVMFAFALLAASLGVAVTAAEAYIYSGDAQCDAAADAYARRMIQNHWNSSAGYEYWHDAYEVENCPVND